MPTRAATCAHLAQLFPNKQSGGFVRPHAAIQVSLANYKWISEQDKACRSFLRSATQPPNCVDSRKHNFLGIVRFWRWNVAMLRRCNNVHMGFFYSHIWKWILNASIAEQFRQKVKTSTFWGLTTTARVSPFRFNMCAVCFLVKCPNFFIRVQCIRAPLSRIVTCVSLRLCFYVLNYGP